jgi:hypothetical protein
MEKIELIYTAVAFVAGLVLERPALVKNFLAKIVKKKKA